MLSNKFLIVRKKNESRLNLVLGIDLMNENKFPLFFLIKRPQYIIKLP